MATLNFKGKSFVQNHHLAVPYHQLVLKKDKSLTDKVRLDDNLIVHGDNLKALKALLPTYAGKVKLIYIDPPYNLGTENWVYNDNVSSPMIQEWLGKVVDREDLARHEKWLCMMTPRLKMLREFLRSDGLIFVSIAFAVSWMRLLAKRILLRTSFGRSDMEEGRRKSTSFPFTNILSVMPATSKKSTPFLCPKKRINRTLL